LKERKLFEPIYDVALKYLIAIFISLGISLVSVTRTIITTIYFIVAIIIIITVVVTLIIITIIFLVTITTLVVGFYTTTSITIGLRNLIFESIFTWVIIF